MNCFCGCDNEVVGDNCYDCDNAIAIECQLDGVCNLCDYRSECYHCKTMISKISETIENLVSIRKERRLTSSEQLQVAELLNWVTDDFGLATLLCLRDFN